MNKHQYRAIAVAIMGIFASFTLWTTVVPHIPLPAETPTTARLLEEALDTLWESLRDASQPPKQAEVSVEDLGEHFADTVRHVARQAAPNQAEPVKLQPQVPSAPVASVSEVVPGPPALPAPHEAAPKPPTELEQWELVTAWGLSIPSLHVRAPVLLPSMTYWSTQSWDLLEQQMQIGLNHGAVAYPHSVSPGNEGSLIIAGHSSPPDKNAANSAYGNLFAKLPDIEIGEEIEVMSGGEVVRYRVEDKAIVSPKATSILQQQREESVLKLITCYPVGTTRDRMIITAKKI